jgi:hypothetical protein
MSESVEILIKADDQASKKFADAATNTERSMKRVEQILGSLEEPAERYNKQLEELKRLQSEGAISSEQFGRAQARLNDKIKGNGNAFKEMGGKAKATTEFVGALASLTGSSEIAGFAGQMAGLTEKVGQFSEVSKSGGAGAVAFKLGLVGLVGTIAVGVGKALGDVIFQTEKYGRAMQSAKEDAAALDAQVAKMNQTRSAENREDIELIRDPEAKRAAYEKLLGDLNKNVAGVSGQVAASKKEVEEWAEAWQVTGERKAAAEMAGTQLATDKARLAALKEQRDEIAKILSVRTAENELLRQQNALQDKSDDFLESLRQEVEYLKATKEERIAIDAIRNATEKDRGEAERLLKERDAIMAKAEAEKEAESAKKRATGEAAKAAQQAIDLAAREVDRIEGIKKAEKERLELQRIEIEQGKEAAKVQALINQGVDAATAKQLAAEQAAIDKLKEKQANEDEIDPKKSGKIGGTIGPLQAAESRLLTRGSGDRRLEVMEKTLAKIDEMNRNTAAAAAAAQVNADAAAKIEENTRNTTQLVPTI